MDFDWTDSERDLYAQTVRFGRDQLPSARALREAGVPGLRRAFAQCGEHGLLGAGVPVHYGGLGQTALGTARLMEALGYGCDDTGLVFALAAHAFACTMPIYDGGDETLRARLLPALCAGTSIGANAITESGAGSDVHALKTRARREGDDYVLDGEKSFVTNGPVADILLVYASTNPRHGVLGLTAFAVPATLEGVTLGKRFALLGLPSAHVGPVTFESCRVPASHRLGREGDGAALFRRSMLWERTCLFAGYLGRSARVLAQTIEHAKQRTQFGRPIGKNQAISHRLVDAQLRLESARLLLYRACWLIDQQREAASAVSLAKLAISELAIQIGLDAIQVHGALGYVLDSGIPQALCDALPTTLFSGTSEIQRDILAAHLGL